MYQGRVDGTPTGARQLIKESADLDAGLSSALLVSLAHVSSLVCAITDGHGLSVQEMFGPLCVLQKQGWAPSSMLARLWCNSE